MARLLPLLILLVLAVALAIAQSGLGGSSRARNTYRPRPKARGAAGAGSERGPSRTSAPVHIFTRSQLAGLRDAYSSAPIDPAQPLARCGQCQAIYHASSLLALRRDNAGRCATCGSIDLGPVRLTDD